MKGDVDPHARPGVVTPGGIVDAIGAGAWERGRRGLELDRFGRMGETPVPPDHP